MIDNEIRVAAIAIILLLGIGLTGEYFLAGSFSQPFSEVGILGPTGKLGDYPSNMRIGDNYALDLYVGNHEGHSMLYTVYEKLGTRSSVINQTVPLDTAPVASYQVVLPDNASITMPITVRLVNPGQSIRLVFELWTFSTTTETLVYEGSWAQLFVNATVSGSG
jgi:uncharacterized membrane protein